MHVKSRGPPNDPHNPADQRGHPVHAAVLQVQVPRELSREPQDDGPRVRGLVARRLEETAHGEVDGGPDAAGGPQVLAGDGEADVARVQCAWSAVLGGHYIDECWHPVRRELLRDNALLPGQVNIGDEQFIRLGIQFMTMF